MDLLTPRRWLLNSYPKRVALFCAFCGLWFAAVLASGLLANMLLHKALDYLRDTPIPLYLEIAILAVEIVALIGLVLLLRRMRRSWREE